MQKDLVMKKLAMAIRRLKAQSGFYPGVSVYIEGVVHPTNFQKDYTDEKSKVVQKEVEELEGEEWKKEATERHSSNSFVAVHFLVPRVTPDEAFRIISEISGGRYTPEDLKTSQFKTPIDLTTWKTVYQNENMDSSFKKIVSGLLDDKVIFVDQDDMETIEFFNKE